jgi:hypothetical protein
MARAVPSSERLAKECWRGRDAAVVPWKDVPCPWTAQCGSCHLAVIERYVASTRDDPSTPPRESVPALRKLLDIPTDDRRIVECPTCTRRPAVISTRSRYDSDSLTDHRAQSRVASASTARVRYAGSRTIGVVMQHPRFRPAVYATPADAREPW